jgi:CheY-like chemotaxis protein
MDSVMPSVDGGGHAPAAQDADLAAVPVIAVSASSPPSTCRLSAGRRQRVLTKPVSLEALQAHIGQQPACNGSSRPQAPKG